MADSQGVRRELIRRREDAKLRTILDANADGIVVVDPSGAICFANPAAGALFGIAPSALVGKQFGFPVVAGSTTEIDVVARPDQPRIAEMRVVEIEWEGEQAYLASLRDITSRRRAEAALADEHVARRAAEASLRARDEFLAVAAHELKTPLTRLGLAAQRTLRRMARDHDEVPEHVTAALHLVEQERRQLARVVEQLLELSRLDHGSIEIERVVVDLRPIVERAIEAFRATSGEVEIRLRAPGEPLLASIDTAVFERMLLALVAGAVRRDHTGGPIEVDLRQPRGARSVEHPSVRLTVRDHGSAPTIHGPARAEDGDAHDRSVDLHLVRRLVELHGGHLTVEHPTDGGTLVAVFVAGG